MDREHRTSDEQSLRLNQAAIDALKQRPEQLLAVLATLAHWDAVAPPDSKPLRDEWREIVLGGRWDRALAPDDHGQQLRQCSPLGRALPAARRLEIIRACKGRNSST